MKSIFIFIHQPGLAVSIVFSWNELTSVLAIDPLAQLHMLKVLQRQFQPSTEHFNSCLVCGSRTKWRRRCHWSWPHVAWRGLPHHVMRRFFVQRTASKNVTHLVKSHDRSHSIDLIKLNNTYCTTLVKKGGKTPPK